MNNYNTNEVNLPPYNKLVNQQPRRPTTGTAAGSWFAVWVTPLNNHLMEPRRRRTVPPSRSRIRKSTTCTSSLSNSVPAISLLARLTCDMWYLWSRICLNIYYLQAYSIKTKCTIETYFFLSLKWPSASIEQIFNQLKQNELASCVHGY